ncbi:MAG: sulfotransferase domain-containing protein [Gemmatimonadota bacterium]
MIRTLSRLWRRARFGLPVVVVSGLPRSGTSMVMQMLEAGGMEAVTDGHRPPDESNLRGYFELERVKALEAGDVAWVEGAQGRVVKVIAYLLEHLPRTSQYRVIFMVRNLDEVLASQAKMLALLGEPADAGPPTHGGEPVAADEKRMREIFYGHMARARRFLAGDPRFEVLYLRHEDVLRDPGTAAEQIVRFIGGNLDVLAMAVAVDPALHRTRRRE